MHPVARYMLTLCCASLICGVILAISGKTGPGGEIRRTICGIFLVMVSLAPLRELDFDLLDRDYAFYAEAAQTAAMQGKQMADRALEEDISRRCEAYILDQAEALSVSLEAEVQVDDKTHLPVRVRLFGGFSEDQKQMLTEKISRELGIERSCQEWNETP